MLSCALGGLENAASACGPCEARPSPIERQLEIPFDMPKPVLLTVDDDADVLSAIARDLRKWYGRDYRILRTDSGLAALTLLHELKDRSDPVALVLSDQRMPEMDGVALLSEAMTLHPRSKRALLTAYADTEAAIGAINKSQVDYYILKPWDPPEEKLYPVLDDLAVGWVRDFLPRADAGHGRILEPTSRVRRGPVDWIGDLLRRGRHGGYAREGSDGLHGGWRELCRPGRDLLQGFCQQGRHDRSRRLAARQDVALPRESHRVHRQHRGATEHGDSSLPRK